MGTIKWKKHESGSSWNPSKPAIPVVHDALVASIGIADGRAIVVLTVDTTNRQDIADLLAAHAQYGSTDAISQWGKTGINIVTLWIRFEAPVRTAFHIDFDLSKWGGIVDQIIRSGIISLTNGKQGDRFDPTDPLIIMEIPSSWFFAEWDKMFHAFTQKEGQVRYGLNKKAAAAYATDSIARWRALTDLRKEG